MRWIGQHAALDDLDQIRLRRARRQFRLDPGEREERLSHRERQGGTDFQDGPVVLDELAQLRRSLVVGGVRLEDQVGFGVEHVPQLGGGAVHVVDDVEVVEFDAGLHHQGDDPRPDVGQAQFGERRAVGVDGPLGAVGGRRDECAQRFVCPAGDGHLGADDVDRAARSECGARCPRRPAAAARCGSPRPRRQGPRDRRRTTCCSRGESWRSRPRRRRRSAPRHWPSPARPPGAANGWDRGGHRRGRRARGRIRRSRRCRAPGRGSRQAAGRCSRRTGRPGWTSPRSARSRRRLRPVRWRPPRRWDAPSTPSRRRRTRRPCACGWSPTAGSVTWLTDPRPWWPNSRCRPLALRCGHMKHGSIMGRSLKTRNARPRSDQEN